MPQINSTQTRVHRAPRVTPFECTGYRAAQRDLKSSAQWTAAVVLFATRTDLNRPTCMSERATFTALVPPSRRCSLWKSRIVLIVSQSLNHTPLALMARTFDPTAPPTPAELKAAKQLVIKDEEGQDVTLGSLIDGDLPVIAIWIRHFVSFSRSSAARRASWGQPLT